MVGHIGRGHHDDGLCHIGQLRYGGGAGPAQHQVRRGHDPGHIKNILPQVHLARGKVRGRLRQLFAHAGIVHLPGAVQQMEALGSVQKGDQLRHDAVHMARAQGAPHGDHQLFILGQTQLPLGLGLGIGRELAPHRGAGDDDLLRLGVILAALLKAHHDAVHQLGQHFGGQAGDGVALMDGGGNVELGSGLQHRVAHIAAGADDGVRLKVTDNGLGLPVGDNHVFQCCDIVRQCLKVLAPAQVGDFQGLDGIALPGHQVHLHFSLGAQKEKLAVRHQLFQPPGHSQGRIDMTGGTAAGKDKFHGETSFLYISSR